ncbi:MAG: hypothetical protein OS112_09735 [Methanoregula sp.]|nr:MAG: hypothetical protein OS112_09735 [Methanoregula sp.]
MRWLTFFIVLLTTVLLLSCGCTQSPPAPPTPAPAADSTAPAATAVEAGPKQINFTVWKAEHDVVMRYDGGRDAAELSMLKVQIDNRDGKIVKTPIYSPEIGKEYLFPYVGIVNPNTINIIGVFKDGTEQTVLLYYF